MLKRRTMGWVAGAFLLLLPCFICAGENPAENAWTEHRKSVLADPALVAYYDFQDSTGTLLKNKAKTGAVLDGKMVNTPWTEGRWKGKGALEFRGNGYVEIPDSQALKMFDTAAGGTGELTIELWCRVTAASESGLVDKFSAGWGVKQANGEGGTPYALWISVKHLCGFIGSDATSQTIRDATEIETGAWLHLALIVDKNRMVMYKNGKAVATADRTVTPQDNGRPLLIGAMKPGLFHFNGIIDEVVLLKRALPETEVAKRFQEGRTMMTSGAVSAAHNILKELETIEGIVQNPELKKEVSRMLAHAQQTMSPLIRSLETGGDLKNAGLLFAETEMISRDFEKVAWKARLETILEQI